MSSVQPFAIMAAHAERRLMTESTERSMTWQSHANDGSLLYLLVFVAILGLLGGSMVQAVDAKGRTKTKTTLSISKRVDIQTDNCEIAGGEISVSYGYESDGSESATTSCSGGLLDGNTCINEETTMECWQSGRVLPTGRLDGTLPLVPITDVQVDQPTPMPGVTDEGVDVLPVSVSDDGSGNSTQVGDGSVLTSPIVDQPATFPGDQSMPMLVPLD